MGWFQLVCTDNNGQEKILRTYSFDNKQIISIGRASACDIQVDNAAVSRAHATIKIAVINGDVQYTLYDPGNNNGTFVNREAVMGQRLLQNRDRITICGQQTIVFHAGNIHHQGETHRETFLYRAD
jgi:pSer/pThr/pTyr-binding forkhead associated (FHA) protein